MASAAMKTLIVDDEPISRRILREGLEAVSDIAIVGEAENGKQALKQIEELRPDLVFLDLQMPVMGGFEVVQRLSGTKPPVVVIVTAFDQHAIQAFDAGAIDYLLKPFSEARLQKAVERARNLHRKPLKIPDEVAKIASALTNSAAAVTRKVVGRTGTDYFLLDANEILAFQAEGELVWIITSKQRLLANQTLRGLEERLREQQFERVHRNALVNINHVRKMSVLSSQRWLITLSNSLQLVASKRQARHIRKILDW